MGTLSRGTYTADPPKARRCNLGEGREDILKGRECASGKILMELEYRIARYVDEDGRRRRVSTRSKDKKVAAIILANLEAEVERIRAGVLTRKDLDHASRKNEPLKAILDKYEDNQIASASGKKHASDTRKKIERLTSEAGVKSLKDITRDAVVGWLADEKRKARWHPER